MTRREVIALTALGASGCAARRTSITAPAPPVRARRYARVLASAARVTRTVVGLRPFRPSGFVVRTQVLEGKTVIHNYGHGGGGMSLSWGSAHLALEQAVASGHRKFAVIGAGAVGLATARLLQRRGFEVMVYAKDLPPNTTSNISGAQWSPVSVFDEDRMTPEFREQFVRASKLAYREFQNFVGTRYGVRWIENYGIHEERDKGFYAYVQHMGIGDLYPDYTILEPGQHPFPGRYASRFQTMMIEPLVYLEAMLNDVRAAGGRIQVRAFETAKDVVQLPEPAIVNCSGLGARTLFGDEELMPIKGQLSVLIPQPEIDYMTLQGGKYMFPRTDGILLGGTFQRGEWSLEPDRDAEKQIVAAHEQFFQAMKAS